MNTHEIRCRSHTIRIDRRPVIMGVLNVTPDSFSDGGDYLDFEQAVNRGVEMADAGAAILDIGGESTRPGAAPVEPEEQIERVIPVIRELARETEVPISIDSTSSKVAVAALDAGAAIVNDISAFRFDRNMAKVVALSGVPVVLMHMQGVPGNMQKRPQYTNVVSEVKTFLAQRIQTAIQAGVEPSRIIIDPGIGFGKTTEHNLLLLKEIGRFNDLKCPILVGPSRKSFIGKVLDIESPRDRLFGTAGVAAWCAVAGVHILRMHDVAEMLEVLRIIEAIQSAGDTRAPTVNVD